MKREKADYTIQSVLHALDILEEFRKARHELGVTELSKALKLHKNNVFRLLATLETRGYIEQNKATGDYRLGIKTFEIGRAFIDQADLVKLARPVLAELRDMCNETVYLALLREDHVVYTEIAETNQSVRVVNRVGALLPAHCTAVGKAQLALYPKDELKRIFTKSKLVKQTTKTIDDRDKFFTHLVEVGKKGYALDMEELEPDVFCIGAPIMDHTGKPAAGICISGPGCRMSKKRMESELAPMVKDSAARISAGLGFDVRAKNKK